MFENWTIGRRLAASFALAGLTLVVIAGLAFFATNALIENTEAVNRSQDLRLALKDVLSAIKDAETGQRGYLLAGEDRYLTPYQQGTASVGDALSRVRSLVLQGSDQKGSASPDSSLQQSLSRVEPLIERRLALLDEGISLRRRQGVDAAVAFLNRNDGQVLMESIRAELSAAGESVRRYQSAKDAAARASADRAVAMIFGGGLIGAIVVGGIGWFISHALANQIGTAVGHVQSSSSELHAAANQQATGVKEQVTSMSEINTTINELLATSRQIAESAQRVSQIAEQTASAARSGDGAVDTATKSISDIRRHVDLVVDHMLELGKKSQQIGAVLDIVAELAEQTNILAINATIEAAGAGEHGKRFSIVADEIRKLADRVAGSAKEIRMLIEDIRSSVNTTIMATETGAKAVESGSRQFRDVAEVFQTIVQSVTNTTEAAREIELSTKQQATAVEQVNIAIANVAQATKETEASAGQTMQTAAELAGTSRNLMRLVQATRGV